MGLVYLPRTYIYHTNQSNVGKSVPWILWVLVGFPRHPHPNLQGSHSSYIGCWGGGRPSAAPFKLQGKPVKQKKRRHGGAMLQVEDVTCFHQKSNRTLPMDP